MRSFSQNLVAIMFFAVFSLLVHLSNCDFQVRPATSPVIHGEGPHWDVDKQVLYFVDIVNHTINKHDPVTEETNQISIGDKPVTLVIPVKFEDEFVVGYGRDLVRVCWDGRSSKPSNIQVLSSVDGDKLGNRFNDGKADSSGRLWAGTMGPENPLKYHAGTLYSFDPFNNFTPVEQVPKVTISNGLAWNWNDTLMYYIDSPTRKIDVFDFDIVEGTIKNRRTLFDMNAKNLTGVPDGMTIDENDNLWVAIYDGSTVLHINNQDGTLINKIEFPAKKITSCSFGGPDLDVLYVTSSRRGLNEEELEKEPLAGSVFKVANLGVKGQKKPNKVRIFSSASSKC